MGRILMNMTTFSGNMVKLARKKEAVKTKMAYFPASFLRP